MDFDCNLNGAYQLPITIAGRNSALFAIEQKNILFVGML
jgi:hypothetical protein